ncbi:MAG: alpha-hydroxy-acid oxidizing protein [Alphaproteobacteria bacterium]|nr:alpha-hydroxy-acid oxidizing protein [Alphaproteobacteria bacterium]
MKKFIFILCACLVVLFVVWLVLRFNKTNSNEVVYDGGYVASVADESIVIYDIDDLEAQAWEVIPQGGFDYIRGGAETENTMKRNEMAFDMVDIYPRVLTGVNEPDITTEILGIDISLPVIVAPAAAHGLAHVSAEAGSARGAAASGTIMSVSTYASSTLEQVAQAGEGAPQWFQLYLSKDDAANRNLIKTAEDLGYRAIILTVDAPVGGNRVSDARNNFKFPLAMPNVPKKSGKTKGQGIGAIFAAAQNELGPYDVMYVKSLTDLPVIVKGIQHPDDAEIAILAGADAIWVSNHGGRQLDGAPASFEVLGEIAERVNKRVPIIFDSGIRRGQHIFKAIAMGADVVAIGRPVIYGLALGGWRGVVSVFDYLKADLERVMWLAGTQNIDDIKNINLRKRCETKWCE